MILPRRRLSQIAKLTSAALIALLISQAAGYVWPTSKLPVFLLLFFVLAAWIYRGERRGRETLLRGLAALPKDQREELLTKKFTPIEAELRSQLRERYQII